MSDIGPVFVLAFDSRDGCPCGNTLEEDDEACYIDGDLCCIECREDAVEAEECMLGNQIENMKRRKQNGK